MSVYQYLNHATEQQELALMQRLLVKKRLKPKMMTLPLIPPVAKPLPAAWKKMNQQ